MALLYGTFVRFLAAVVESSEIQAPTVILARALEQNIPSVASLGL